MSERERESLSTTKRKGDSELNKECEVEREVSRETERDGRTEGERARHGEKRKRAQQKKKEERKRKEVEKNSENAKQRVRKRRGQCRDGVLTFGENCRFEPQPFVKFYLGPMLEIVCLF